jgi:lysophospholipase L1-like esterase
MFRFILAAGLCLTVVGVNAQHTLVIIGSSTSEGTGASTYDSSYAGRYAKYLKTLSGNWSLVNLAVGGYTTYQLMATGNKPPTGRPNPDINKNITKAVSLKPDVILFSLGDNDIGNNYTASEYQNNYDSIKAVATKAGIPMWVTSTVPRTSLDETGRAEVLALRTRIMQRYAPRAIDFFDGLGEADGKYIQAYNSGDGIHTNNRGHELLFKKVVAANLTQLSSPILAQAGIAGAPAEARGALLRRSGNGMLILTGGLSGGGLSVRSDARGRRLPVPHALMP